MPAAQSPAARLLALATRAAAAHADAIRLRADAHALLRPVREAAGRELRDVAHAAGITPGALSNAELGGHRVRLGYDALARVARVLAGVDRAA